jgi:hypothetical protein
MKKLKLYVWHGVLPGYTDGIAFALAYSVKEAVEQVKKFKCVCGEYHWNGNKLDGVEPVVYRRPWGHAIYGGN